MLPGLLPFALDAVIDQDPVPWSTLCLVTALGATLTLVVLLTFKSIARAGEAQPVLNLLAYSASPIVTLLLFPGQPELAAVVLAVLAFGDGSATLMGLLFGSRPLPWNSQKTWVGTACLCCLRFPWRVARPDVSLASAAISASAAALLAAVAESLPVRLTDNLRVGVAAAVGMIGVHVAFLGWS